MAPDMQAAREAQHMHETFMREALDMARAAADMGEIPVGAVLVRAGAVIARAHNLCEHAHDATAHAELLALRAGAAVVGGWRLPDCTLYVTLEPCPMCAGAVGLARLAGVWFGARDPRMGCCGSVYRLPADAALSFATPSFGGLLADECAALLRAFFEERRQTQKAPPGSGQGG